MENRVNEVKFLGRQRKLLGVAPKIGEKAPTFSGVEEDHSTFNSQSLNGKIRVLSIVPSVDTSVCAAQTIRFNEEVKNFEDVSFVTLSCDTPFALGKFKREREVNNIVMVSDHISLSFGMKYGMVMEGLRLLARGIFIIDKNDDLRYVQITPDASNDVNFTEALDFVKQLREE